MKGRTTRRGLFKWLGGAAAAVAVAITGKMPPAKPSYVARNLAANLRGFRASRREYDKVAERAMAYMDGPRHLNLADLPGGGAQRGMEAFLEACRAGRPKAVQERPS